MSDATTTEAVLNIAQQMTGGAPAESQAIAALHAAETAVVKEEAATAAVAPSAAKIAAIVDSWFNDSILNSPASRDTVVFNHVNAAVRALKTRLAALT